MPDLTGFQSPSFAKRTIVIVGGYGSGKSEVSVNLARFLAKHGDEPVSIADLDIINPYFRSREAAKQLEKLGIKSLIPPGEQVHADLPIVIPEIKGAIQQHEGYLILDVGGDDQGARVLSSLAGAFPIDSYDLLLVHNANRPFTSDVEGSLHVMSEIEGSAQLEFTGLIANSHMMDLTTRETVLEGLDLTKRVAKKREVSVSFLSAETKVLKLIDPKEISCAVLPLNRSLLKPWERNTTAEANGN